MKRSTTKKKHVLFRLWTLSERKYLMIIQILCSIYLTGTAIVTSKLAQRTIDEQLAVTNFPYVASVFAIIAVTGIIISFLGEYAGRNYAIHFTYKLKEQCMETVSKCQLRYLKEEHSGTVINKMTNDVSKVSTYISSSLPEVLRAFIAFVFSFLYLLYINWWMTLVCIICVPIAVGVAKKFANPTYDAMEQFFEEMDGLSAMAKDTIVDSKVEKAYGIGGIRKAEFDQRMDGATKIYIEFERLMAKSGAFKYLLHSAPTLICILAGFVAAFTGHVTGGVFASFILLLRNVSDPLSKFIGYVTDYKEAEVSMDRVMELLTLPSESLENNQIGEEKVCHLQHDQSAYGFEHVSFSYGETSVFSNICGEIRKNEMTAIIGESGGGKSTLFQLLTGFEVPDNGVIYMNGYDMKDRSKEEIRESIAYVEQNSFLFQQTVAENIAMGRENASMNDIVRAAKMAYAHDFIMKLPQGYETILHEGGLNLSGGQRQRLSIARAFLKDAQILLLDEMTSALDEESERLIQQALESYRTNRTLIVVAHRLSTIQNADRILRLANGQLEDITKEWREKTKNEYVS